MSSKRLPALSVSADGIAVLQLGEAGDPASRFCAGPAGIGAALDGLAQHAQPRGLVLLWQAEGGSDCPDHAPQAAGRWSQLRDGALARLAESAWPSVAAWQGACDGVAAEIALHCDYRLAVDDTATSFGCTHTAQGQLPSMHTLHRLAEARGVDLAVLLVAGAQRLPIRSARALQLVDVLVADPGSLRDAALSALRGGAVGRSPGPRPAARAAHAGRAPSGTPDGRVEQLLRDVVHPFPPAALAAYRLLLPPAADDRAPGTARPPAVSEGAHCDLADDRQQASLRHVAGLAERAAGVPGALSGAARRIRDVGICGAGVMGRGIAVAHLRAGVPVRLYDASREVLEQAVQQVQDSARREAGDGWYRILFPHHAPQSGRGCRQESELAACDLVLESVVENRALKQRILGRLEALAAADTVLASNTSTASISALAEQLDRPQQFCGLHFCNPVPQRKLVEVVRGARTSDATLATVLRHVRRIGKLPILVADRPGFVVNRLLVMYLNEALQMLCEGTPLQAIDTAARDFGMPLGPFELLDMIGTDTAMMAGRTMWEAYPERIALNPVLPALVKRERLGWKTHSGFYRYDGSGMAAVPDDRLTPILAPYLRPGGAAAAVPIIERLLLPMLLEATRVLHERVVPSVRDVDTAVVFGLGFPADRGGLLYWADQLGTSRVLELQRALAQLGQRMEQSEYLRQMTAAGVRFYR